MLKPIFTKMASDSIFPRALTLGGQIMIFHSGWETPARYVGLAGNNPEETSEIRRIIVEQTRAAFWVAENGCGSVSIR